MLPQFGFLCFQRHVLRAEQFDLQFSVAVEHFKAGAGKFRSLRVLQENLREPELPRLDLRVDVLHEMQIGPLGFFVVGVAGHRDIAAGRFLIERGGQLTPIDQPAFEVSD